MLHPLETFDQLKVRRLYNYDLLKARLSLTSVVLKPLRLEIYIKPGEQINSNVVTLYGSNVSLSELVLYPFTPKEGIDATVLPLFKADTGYLHTFANLTIKHAQPDIYFESYTDVILKPGGVANAIYFNTFRPDFFTDQTPGKRVWFTWLTTVLGETKVIQSIDALNQIIYLTTNITGTVAADTPGNFGTNFKESIDETEYLNYGGSWYINLATNFIIQGYSITPVDYTVNTNNVVFTDNFTAITLSMGYAKVNMNNTTLKNSALPFSFFAAGIAGGQTVTLTGNTLVENNGIPIIGSISVLDATLIYGSGAYLHDSIIVNQTGTLTLLNNLAGSWRQYSSGYNIPNPGFNYYQNIVESGSTEYCLLTSNTVPTVIDNIDSYSQIRLRHDTVINGGIIRGLIFSYGLHFGLGSRDFQAFNTEFLGRVQLNFFDTVLLQDCVKSLDLFSDYSIAIELGVNNVINNLQVNKNGSVGTWAAGVTAGARGSNLFSLNQSITIDNLIFDSPVYCFMFDCSVVQKPLIESNYSIVINNTVIDCYAMFLEAISTTAGTVSKIFTGNNVTISNYFIGNQSGKYLPQNIAGNQGLTSLAVTAAKTLSVYGALTDILQISHEFDEYETSGTISCIHATNSWANSYSGNPVYGRNIRLHAVGGNITLKTFDAGLRPKSNIIGPNDTIILNGNFLDLTIQNDYVFMTGTTQVLERVILTGNGVLTSFRNVLNPDFILDPNVILNFKCGALDINADANGFFNHPDVQGYVDYWSGKWQFVFTLPLGALVEGKLTYNIPNTWQGTGAWII